MILKNLIPLKNKNYGNNRNQLGTTLPKQNR